jgi:hypothetical protein
MFAKDHEAALKDLMQKYCGDDIDIVYTDDLVRWCNKCGVKAPDNHNPMILLNSDDGKSKLVLQEIIPEASIEERIRALSIRWALQSNTDNLADRLNSDKKRLSYLLLKEFAKENPEMDDELVADNWVFGELRRYGFFKE